MTHKNEGDTWKGPHEYVTRADGTRGYEPVLPVSADSPKSGIPTLAHLASIDERLKG